MIEWYRSTLVTRADDKQAARIVVVMQRVHVDDLVGYLQEQDAGFEVLNLPAIAQSDQTYDARRRPHLYAAERRAAASRSRAGRGAARHQEEHGLDGVFGPISAGARAALRQDHQAEVCCNIIPSFPSWKSATASIVSWDIALSEKEAADYSAGVALLNRGEIYYVLDVVRGQIPFEPAQGQNHVHEAAVWKG